MLIWTVGLYINGEFVASSTESPIASIDPTTEKEICSVASASQEDVDRAVIAGRKAFHSSEWFDMEPEARGALLNKLADVVEAEADLLVEVESWDAGKTIADAKLDVEGLVSVFR
jgi:aldehyde dehydrogenase (NAD+)